MYSTYWTNKNTAIKTIEIIFPNNAVDLSPFKKAWCPQVITKPADNNNTVFNKGKPLQSIELIPIGGQTANSTDGFKAEWKKAQKNEANNYTSVIKKITKPNIKPSLTASV